ncbi:cupin domain-containing protein [uncultured Pontibacter sp.]|uniref:cupin domain-containing protein n=1 Tax=uncultured Pontibacter sp. TaxID=453356 RepID=UPI00263299B2|nr:cupin domain-containing protein [uncultured Pontibacter sp.]
MIACNTNTAENTNTVTRAEASPPDTQADGLNKIGYTLNIEEATLANEDYRRVLYTGEHMQLVLMSLKPNEEIGMEIHQDNDQFFRFESGSGKSIINGKEYIVGDGDIIFVPAGANHNIINTDATQDLKLYSLYAAPTHKDGLVNATKAEAEVPFDGQTTE